MIRASSRGVTLKPLNLSGAHDSSLSALHGTLVVALLSGLLSACGGSGDAEGPTWDQTTSALIGGSLSPSQNDAVVFLRAKRDGRGDWLDCTATLLSPTIVLTARHCVSSVQPGGFVCLGNGELSQNGSGSGMFGDTFAPSSIAIYVGSSPGTSPTAFGARVFATQATSACRDDVALVVLDRPVTVGAYGRLPSDARLRPGEKVNLIGYGLGGRNDGIERRELAEVRVTEVAAANASAEDTSATLPPRTFAVGGGTLCYGDSGGPAFSSTTGAIVGLYSRITGDCFAPESRNTFMAVGGYTALIAQAFEETGETRFLETTTGSATDAGRESESAPTSLVGPTRGGASSPGGRVSGCAVGALSPRDARAWPVEALFALVVASGLVRCRTGRRSVFAGARSRDVPID